VRQALSYAIDRDGITSKLLKGLVQPAYGYEPPSSWAFNPNAVKYTFDLDKAAKTLEDAGWKLNADGVREKGGVKLSYKIVNIAGEQERVTILTAIIANWKKIGVNAEIELVDVGKMWGDLLPNKTFEMGYSYSGLTADPDLSNMFYCPANSPVSNYASYCNATVDAAIKAELSTFDQALRKDALWKAQEQIAIDVPYLYLSWRADHTGVNKRVKGYLPCPGYIELWNAADWTVQ
jgi:peptide/nickel transport system substrate-binding protein